jgi:oxygen-dependent protoporphyrinogen oxidase
LSLFEASDRLGGVLQTVREGGWLIERSADMFTTREPWALDLCRRIGIADELIETDARFRKAYVVRRGSLVPVPEGFTLMSPARVWPIVKTPILSPLGKLRLACEYLIPAKKSNVDESLESFVVRRFGREAFDRLVQPLIGGIYTADPAKLSVQATLPQFVEMERRQGSLIRGMRVQGSEFRGQGGQRSWSILTLIFSLNSEPRTLNPEL